MSSIQVVRGNYKTYTLEQKRRAVQLGVEYSFGYASEQLKIPKSTITTWKKNFDKGVVGIVKRTGHLRYDKEIDLEIRDWVLQQRELDLPVSRANLTEYAKRKINQPSFLATDGWLRHFMKRHDLSLRARTKVAQRTPADVQRRMDIFYRQIEDEALETEFVHVINMDETPTFGDLPATRTISAKGVREVAIRTTGAEKRRYSIALTVTLAGTTLPPLVIFKGKRWPSDIQKVPSGVFVEMQENAWMTENIMLRWIDNILVPFTAHAPTLLILDAFSGHTTPAVMEKLYQINVTPVVIPGGCTAKIQPLDVSLNKPFKDQLRDIHNTYLQKTAPDASGRTPKASRQVLLESVNAAWTYITSRSSMVTKSFSACGITQALARATHERTRRRQVLLSALDSDDSDTEFTGFTESDVPLSFLDDNNPFLENSTV